MKRWNPSVQKQALSRRSTVADLVRTGKVKIHPQRPITKRTITRYQNPTAAGEIKSMDTINPTSDGTSGFVPFPFDTGSTPGVYRVACLNNVTIGSSTWNRIGRRIQMRSLRIRAYVVPTGNGGTNDTPIFMRLVVLYDRQSNGALPTFQDCFRDQTSLATDANGSAPTSGLNMNNRDRFDVIIDEQWVLPNVATGSDPGVNATGMTDGLFNCQKDLFRDLRNRDVVFKSDTSPQGMIGDIATGGLVMWTIGNFTAATAPWSMLMSIRLRFADP